MNKEVRVTAMDHSETVCTKKEETDDMPNTPCSMFVEDPLEVLCSPDFIKEEPEVILEVDETENDVLTSTRYECDSTRLINNTGESCGISVEEPYCREVAHEKLGKGTTDNLIDKAVHRPAEKCHICEVCGMSFIWLSGLKRHELKHTGERPHECDVCGKSFTQLNTLKRHAKMHTGYRPHKCDTCGKYFTQLQHLKNHILIHTGIKPHKCEVCGKCFTELVTLKKHMLIHSGERPHKCDICGKSFTQSGSLSKHLLIHNRKTQYKCDVCGKSFSLLGTLKRHAVLHIRKTL